MAERSGAIADVTVRYKDLVNLRNSVARANLSLDSLPEAPGPLELNVVKNLVASQLSALLDEAAQALGRGDNERALDRLISAQILLIGLAREVPGWSDDPELLHDARVLASYIQAISSGLADPTLLAASLSFASFAKLVPPYGPSE